jgi:hypothetical protein
MRHNTVPALVLAAALGACSLQPEALNSERIKNRFGSYGIVIIEQDARLRRSSLYSTDGGIRTCRTYAVVEFVGDYAGEISTVHQKIVNGSSIGTTFTTDGWNVRKETFHIGGLALDDMQHPVAGLMNLQSPAHLGIHAYDLHVGKGSQSIHYATIIELHHPDYLSEEELRSLYPVPDNLGSDENRVNDIQELVLDQR